LQNSLSENSAFRKVHLPPDVWEGWSHGLSLPAG